MLPTAVPVCPVHPPPAVSGPQTCQWPHLSPAEQEHHMLLSGFRRRAERLEQVGIVCWWSAGGVLLSGSYPLQQAGPRTKPYLKLHHQEDSWLVGGGLLEHQLHSRDKLLPALWRQVPSPQAKR